MSFRSTDFSFGWLRTTELEEVYQLSRKFGGEDFLERESFDQLIKEDGYGCLKAIHKETKKFVAFLAFQKRAKDSRIMRLCCETSSLVPTDFQDHLSMALLKALTIAVPEHGKPFSVVVRESDLQEQLRWKRLGFKWVKTQMEWFDCPPETAFLFVQQREEKS